MGKKAVILWSLILILSLSTSGTIAQTNDNCRTSCYDPDFDIEVGDTFTWYAKNLLLNGRGVVTPISENVDKPVSDSGETTTQQNSDLPGPLPLPTDGIPLPPDSQFAEIVVHEAREVITIELEVLQSLKGVSENEVNFNDEAYFRIDAIVNVSSIDLIGSEHLYVARVPVPLISGGIRLDLNNQLVNKFEYKANDQPFVTYEFQTTSDPSGGSTRDYEIIIEQYIVGESYYEATYTNVTELEEDTSTSWREARVLEIDIHTGLLVSYNHTETDIDGRLLNQLLISDKPFISPKSVAVIDFKIAELLLLGTVFGILAATIALSIYVSRKRSRVKRLKLRYLQNPGVDISIDEIGFDEYEAHGSVYRTPVSGLCAFCGNYSSKAAKTCESCNMGFIDENPASS